MRTFFFTFVIMGLLVSTAVGAAEKLPTVQKVDLNRYLGKWYEIARIENRFQKGCYDSTADYSLRDDGDLRVVNSCKIAGKAKRKLVTGRAWVTDKSTQAKLKVQFAFTGIKLSFMAGRYWILDLAEDYSYVLVGEPSREYLWILARENTLQTEVLNTLIDKAAALGYDRSQIILNENLRP